MDTVTKKWENGLNGGTAFFSFPQVKPVETIQKNLKTATPFLIYYISLNQQKLPSLSFFAWILRQSLRPFDHSEGGNKQQEKLTTKVRD